MKSHLAQSLAPPAKPAQSKVPTATRISALFSQKSQAQITEILRKHEDHLRYWQVAGSRWNLLYYCHRCDGVFQPSLEQFVPINEMLEYIYEFKFPEKFLLYRDQSHTINAIFKCIWFYVDGHGISNRSKRIYKFDFDQASTTCIYYDLTIEYQETQVPIMFFLKTEYERLSRFMVYYRLSRKGGEPAWCAIRRSKPKPTASWI